MAEIKKVWIVRDPSRYPGGGAGKVAERVVDRFTVTSPGVFRSAAVAEPMSKSERIEWVEAELLLHREGGKTVGTHIQEYFRDFIARSQALHAMIHKQIDSSKATVSGGDTITRQDVEAAIRGAVEGSFGEDALSKLFVKVLANGDFIY